MNTRLTKKIFLFFLGFRYAPEPTARFQCPNFNCRSVFKQHRNLVTHVNYQCGKPPRYKCSYCIYEAKYSQDVKKHIERLHPHCKILVVDKYFNYALNQKYRSPNKSMIENNYKIEVTPDSKFFEPEQSEHFVCPKLDCKKIYKYKSSWLKHINSNCTY